MSRRHLLCNQLSTHTRRLAATTPIEDRSCTHCMISHIIILRHGNSYPISIMEVVTILLTTILSTPFTRLQLYNDSLVGLT